MDLLLKIAPVSAGTISGPKAISALRRHDSKLSTQMLLYETRRPEEQASDEQKSDQRLK